MSYIEIRDEYFNILETVEGIGRVHKTERNTDTWKAMIARHSKDNRIASWFITRPTFRDEIAAVQGKASTIPWYHIIHDIRMNGILGVREAKDGEDEDKNTDTEFQALIDSVAATFRVKPLLNGKAITPVQRSVPVIGHKVYGGVFCHSVEFQYLTTERVGGE